MRHLSPAEEAERLLAWHGEGALGTCLDIVSQQFQVIQQRSQLLLTLATLTLTITGFSGPQIASTNALARWSIAIGIVLVLISVIMVLVGTLRINWVTQMSAGDDQQTLEAVLDYRNSKTSLYRLELSFLVVGLACYVCSVVTYLVCLPG